MMMILSIWGIMMCGKMNSKEKKNFFNLTDNKIKGIVISNFSENMEVMLKSGVSLLNALKAFNENYKNRMLNKIIKKVINNIQMGISFSESLEQFSKYFPNLFITMIKSAEASGTLISTFSYLKNYYYKDHQIKEKMKGALVYPILLLILMTIIVLALMFFIIPKFEDVFDNLNIDEIPPLTMIIFNISRFVRNHFIILILIILLIYLCIKIINKFRSHLFIDYLKTKILIYKDVEKLSITSMFTRSLSMMYLSGIPLFIALDKTINLINNRFIKKKLTKAASRVYQGQNIASALSSLEYFPTMMVEMLKIGEESNNLGSVLSRMSEYYDLEAENRIGKLAKSIEPLIIVLMAVVVSLVVLAVFLPMFKIMNEMVGI